MDTVPPLSCGHLLNDHGGHWQASSCDGFGVASNQNLGSVQCPWKSQCCSFELLQKTYGQTQTFHVVARHMFCEDPPALEALQMHEVRDAYDNTA